MFLLLFPVVIGGSFGRAEGGGRAALLFGGGEMVVVGGGGVGRGGLAGVYRGVAG